MSAPVSSYLQYLPSVLYGDFLGRFLLAFEAVLSGANLSELSESFPEEGELLGLEQLLDKAHEFFDPDKAPEDFLPWLAQWVATGLREDWDLATKKKFLGQIVPLYRMRGTRLGIQEVLRLSGDEAQVVDFGDGKDEPLEAREFGPDPKPPHLFGVILTVSVRDTTLLARKVRRVCAIVDREKPAHTFYALRVLYPAMRINNDPKNNKPFGPGIVVNRNTVLGTMKA